MMNKIKNKNMVIQLAQYSMQDEKYIHKRDVTVSEEKVKEILTKGIVEVKELYRFKLSEHDFIYCVNPFIFD